MASVSHIVCLFCVTAGKNGDDLGSDEEQIVQIIFLLYDIANNKTVSVQEFHVRPTSGNDVTETVLTEECKQTTGLTERQVQNGQSLEQVLDELDRFLRTKEVHPDHGGRPICLCTDGPLHLRMVLHPETFQKNITLSPYFYKYFDLRKQFTSCYKPTRTISSLDDMLSVLSLSSDQSVGYGVRHCQHMALILQRLINDGFQFTDPESIMDRLEPGILNRSDVIDDDTVVKARGLPWQSSEQDIINFFRGLNVARGGVALCLSAQGRRNGEALVRFESGEQRSLALRRHKHHLGQRYIEVYKATGRDFISVAGGGNREAQAFLSHQSGSGIQIIVRMRGLPYSCKADQVIQFFNSGPNPVEVLDGEEGVLFVHQADGRATGDAFVLFPSEEEANRALTKHKQLIGTRYIELFKSTTAEVQQVLNRSMDPRSASIYDPKGESAALLATAAALVPSFAIPGIPTGPQQIIPAGSQRDCIRLRGLPYEAQVGDVIQFLGDVANDVVCQGVHLIYRAEGTPSGEAFIQMNSDTSAKAAVLGKHNKTMFLMNKKRSVEVIQCSGDEMSIILNNGLTDTLAPIPSGAAAAAAGTAAAMSSVGAYWVQQGVVPPAAAPGVLTRSAMGLQSRQSAVETGIPQFFSPVLASPAAILQTTGFVYPGGGQLPLASPILPTIAAVPCSTPSPNLPPQTPVLTPTLPAFPHHVIAVQQVPMRQPTPAAVAPTLGQVPGASFQPMVYWYTSPGAGPQTISAPPQGAYYVPLGSSSSSVSVKGLPPTVQPQDLLAFFDGSYESLPDVQLQRGPDGRPTGDAIVTFLSAAEADRAINDKHRKVMANRVIEVHGI